MESDKRETIVLEKKDVCFEKVHFVLRAMDKTDNRGFAHGLMGTGDGTLVATDGKRLHMWKDTAPHWTGFYAATTTKTLITLMPDPETQFPKWEAVVPNYEKPILENIELGKSKKNCGAGIFKIYQHGIPINIHYLFDLEGYCWDIYADGPEKACLFKDDHLLAVIMPFMPTIKGWKIPRSTS